MIINYNILNQKIKLHLNKKVFTPNITTKLLLEAACARIEKKNNKHKLDILDLGCGSGVIGIFLKKKYKSKINVFMSDYSNFAVEIAKKNSKLNNIKATILISDVFKSWKNHKFDLIIDDISAIDTEVAKKSTWYNKHIPCKSGSDGIAMTEKVIKLSREFLKKKSIILIPSISISNHKKNINVMKKNFKEIKEVSCIDWPAPKFLLNKKIIKKMIKKLYIYKKFNMFLCFTKIYSCSC